MTTSADHVKAFYARHPISAEHILAKIEAARGSLDGLRPEDLWPHDQDHYGGLAANDVLAERTGLVPGLAVADLCAGLGGPARYLAYRYGVTVTGVELTPARVAGANRLTAAVGLDDRVRVVEGDVMAVPLPAASQDVVVSQEALLHVPDKAAAIGEAARILRPGGRFAFTDWIAHRALTRDETETMWVGIAAQTLQSIPGYRALLDAAGFARSGEDDLTEAWGGILSQRLRMYERLREETRAAGKPSGDDAFYAAYSRLVELVRAGALGGARFVCAR